MKTTILNLLSRARSLHFLFLSPLLFAANVCAAPDAPVSAQYGALTVVVSGKTVTGTFFDHRGEPGPSGVPPFSCIFSLKGTLSGDTADITTWMPGKSGDKIRGKLKFVGGGSVSLSLDSAQAGCQMTGDEMASEPWTESISKAGEHWIAVGFVAADHAPLYASPQVTHDRRPYLIQDDPVVILEHSGDWVRVLYLYGSSPITGWLRAQTLIKVDTH